MTEILQLRDKHGRWIENPQYQWYLQKNPGTNKPYKVAYFDTEFSDLNPDFGWITMWAIKERDGKIKQEVMTLKELHSKDQDKRLVYNFWEEAKKYDLLIGFYSAMCDLPYLKTVGFHHKMNNIPEYRTKRHLDLYFAVRDKIKLSSRSLKNVCAYLGIEGKVDLTHEEWKQVKILEPKATKKLIERNKFDTVILETLHKRFEKYVKFNKNWL